VDNNVFIGTNNLRTLDASGVVFANNLIANPNNSINIEGGGRGCFWFTPGTMAEYTRANMGGTQSFWWYNNIATRPITNTSGSKTHTKVNTIDNLSGFSHTASSNTMTVSFTLNTADLSQVPATKEAIGKITFPTGYTVGEFIQDDVTHDFFGKPYTAGAKTAGPFADATNGVNNYTLWPISGQEVPPAFVINN
jgi:hypothetical protein